MTLLEAGPALDRRIALEVLGWHLYHYDKDFAPNCYWMLLDADGESAVWAVPYAKMEHPTEEAAWAVCPRFSTEWAAAEPILAQFDVWQLQYDARPRTKRLSYACHLRRADSGLWVTSYAATVPLALCTAALYLAGRVRQLTHLLEPPAPT